MSAPIPAELLDQLNARHATAAARGLLLGDGEHQRRVDAQHELVAAVPQLTAALRAALDLADEWERGATRWEQPLPVPPQVGQLRDAITAALSPADPMGPSSREDQQ